MRSVSIVLWGTTNCMAEAADHVRHEAEVELTKIGWRLGRFEVLNNYRGVRDVLSEEPDTTDRGRETWFTGLNRLDGALPTEGDLQTIRRRLSEDCVVVAAESEQRGWVSVHVLDDGGGHSVREDVTRFNGFARPVEHNAWKIVRATVEMLGVIDVFDATLTAVGKRVGHLVESVLLDLADQNSELRKQLQASDIEIDFLRNQVTALTAALREAQRTGKRSILKAGLAGFAGILLAVTTGVAEGVSGQLVSSSKQDRIVPIVEQCRELGFELEASP